MQITNIGKETGSITSDLVDFKRIIREQYNILYISDNLEDMDRIKHIQPQFTQHETDHLNSIVTLKEIKIITLKCSRKN